MQLGAIIKLCKLSIHISSWIQSCYHNSQRRLAPGCLGYCEVGILVHEFFSVITYWYGQCLLHQDQPFCFTCSHNFSVFPLLLSISAAIPTCLVKELPVLRSANSPEEESVWKNGAGLGPPASDEEFNLAWRAFLLVYDKFRCACVSTLLFYICQRGCSRRILYLTHIIRIV